MYSNEDCLALAKWLRYHFDYLDLPTEQNKMILAANVIESLVSHKVSNDLQKQEAS